MMDREDILRELELLPVWQLRYAKPVAIPVVTENVIDKPVATGAETPAVEQATEAPEDKHVFRLMMSDDLQWAFVLNSQQNDESEALLLNMLKAISVKVSNDIIDANLTHLSQYKPKMIVVMGEAEAQQLLNKRLPLEQLRGKAHQYQNIAVVATYTPSHLLMHLQDKANAWEDLCLAKFTIASL